MMGLVGDREALPTGDHLPASSQGKTVNLLLGMGAGNGGRSHLRFFSRENCESVIGNE
ncbi:hypothetical protein [Cylindrospermopsis raciborskii]|uniref:hypothetical protein n=1 Tax=Cylindrospermopsis raciborskii TaxID=77022 RepID=UPI00387A03B8